MKRRRNQAIFLFIICVIVLLTISGNFANKSPKKVNCNMNQDVTLPCQIPPGIQPQTADIQWKKRFDDHTENIYQYTALTGHETFRQGYQDRIMFSKEKLLTRNVSLKLERVQVADEGVYVCTVKSSNEKSTETEVVLLVCFQDHDGSVSFLWFPVFFVVAIAAQGATICYFKSKEKQKKPQRKLSQISDEFFENETEEGALLSVQLHPSSHPKLEQPHQKWVSCLLVSCIKPSYKETLKEEWEALKEEHEILKKEHDMLKEEHETLKKEHEQITEENEHLRTGNANVILNHETAHPRLEVFEDGKCVRDTGFVLKVSQSQGRFESHMFVLAKEGFSKGQHYWEVEVGEKKSWDLGVASESISRKGKITLSPHNGFWVIGLDGKRDYWARTDPWTRLKVSGKPTIIGIFLDMSTRSLSFHDVHGKCLMYKFTIQCTGKLWPFFSAGSVAATLDDQPLKIVR